MGDNKNTPLKLNFDPKVRLDFRGAAITSDAGLLACRYLRIEGCCGNVIMHGLPPDLDGRCWRAYPALLRRYQPDRLRGGF